MRMNSGRLAARGGGDPEHAHVTACIPPGRLFFSLYTLARRRMSVRECVGV